MSYKTGKIVGHLVAVLVFASILTFVTKYLNKNDFGYETSILAILGIYALIYLLSRCYK